MEVPPRTGRTLGSTVAGMESSLPGTAVIARADEGSGLLIAEALAGLGMTVVMHSTRGSEAISDSLDQIVSGGGKALAVECDLVDEAEPASLLFTLSRVVGPARTVILQAPESGIAEADPSYGDHLGPEALQPAQELIRWSRGLVSALTQPSTGTAIAVLPGRPPEDVTSAVRLGAWMGALEGLRLELRQLGARVHEVIAADPEGVTLTRKGARLAAERIAKLVARGPAEQEEARGGMQ